MELQIIQDKIYEIRGQKVMLDFDLAEMYKVETKRLNESVRRNHTRFPKDFMFQLTDEEWTNLRTQFATSNRGGRRYLPYAFTEQGVAMLSGLLNSEVAISVNISIMRAFVAIRQYALGYAELNRKIDDFMQETNMQFNDIYQALTELAEQKKTSEQSRKRIGFKYGNTNDDNS
jgi:hypothetical protein